MSHLPYSVDRLAEITGARVVGEFSGVIHRLVFDSRSIHFGADCLFAAFTSDQNDGHRYVSDAYARGVRIFLVEREVEDLADDAAQLVVKEVLVAWQSLGGAHRGQFGIPVVGISGSNGKTVVKEWLNMMLARHFSVVRSPRSFNSQIGVPFSLWNIEAGHELALIEAGISLPGEMHALAEIIRPSHVILTNLLDAHAEHFASRQHRANEKAQLARHAHHLIYRADYPEWDAALGHLGFRPAMTDSWSSQGNPAQWQVSAVKGTRHQFVSATQHLYMDLPSDDPAAFENAVHCALFMHRLGYGEREIQAGLARLHAIPMRMELLEGKRRNVLLSDAYSSDPASLEIALDALARHAEGRPRVAVLSGMEQTGQTGKRWANALNGILKSHSVNQLFAVGKVFAEERDAFELPVVVFPDVRSLLSDPDFAAVSQSAVLVKGARSYGLEEVVQRMQRHTHDTVLEVDLTAARHNLHFFRSKLRMDQRLMAMVKASGYGSGSVELAQMLAFNGVDYLAVAYVDEGIELREHGISLPIMVLNPETAALSDMLDHRLEPEIYSFRTLRALEEALEWHDSTAQVGVHLKINTGMHRLGFDASELPALIEALEANPRIRVASMFTHLSAADDPNADGFSQLQTSRFEQAAELVVAGLGYKPLLHVFNTAGILSASVESLHRFDMVRLGIGLYGISPLEKAELPLLPIHTLRGIVSQVRPVPSGVPVGYSRSEVLQRDSRIATISIGYADGLPRALSNGKGSVWINGNLAPIVGRVCMDMTMVDVTGIPVEEGDPVEAFGRNIPVIDVAEQAGTIAYEVLASISPRVKRVYIQE